MALADPRIRTREAPEVRRAQLLDAAERVVLERGVRAATMAEVAAAAGVAKGTTYLYFPSKDELIAALRERYLDKFTLALQAGSEAASARVRLAAFVDGLFRFANEHQALHHALFHDAGFAEVDAMAGAREVLGTIVSDGVADGSFAIGDDDIGAATVFLVSGIHGALIGAVHPSHTDFDDVTPVAEADLERAIGTTIRIVERALAVG